jgi:hypothetical protein
MHSDRFHNVYLETFGYVTLTSIRQRRGISGFKLSKCGQDSGYEQRFIKRSGDDLEYLTYSNGVKNSKEVKAICKLQVVL